jgi:hypothetical protein
MYGAALSDDAMRQRPPDFAALNPGYNPPAFPATLRLTIRRKETPPWPPASATSRCA